LPVSQLSYLCVILFFLYASATPRHLHSFPTRRSSDLGRSRDRRHAIRDVHRTSPDARRGADRGHVLHRRDQEVRLHAPQRPAAADRKSTRLNSSHQIISYAVFCLKKKNKTNNHPSDIP